MEEPIQIGLNKEEIKELRETIGDLKEQVNTLSRSNELKFAKHREAIENLSAEVRCLKQHVEVIERMFGGSYNDMRKNILKEIQEKSPQTAYLSVEDCFKIIEDLDDPRNEKMKKLFKDYGIKNKLKK